MPFRVVQLVRDGVSTQWGAQWARMAGPRPFLERVAVVAISVGILLVALMVILLVAVVAVPVAPHDTIRRLRGEADEVIVLLEPADFMAVGRWYEDFSQTSDEDVRRLMESQRSWITSLG